MLQGIDDLAESTESAASQYSDDDVDQMLAAFERGEDDFTPGGGEAEAPVEQAQSDTEQAVDDWLKREFEYHANGKQVKEPLEMILKRASQGYNYAQHMEALKQEQATLQQTIEQKAQEYIAQKYGQIDEFARQNPEWMDYVNQQFQLAKQNGELARNPDDPVQREIAALKQQISDLTNQTKTFQEQERAKKEDEQLSQEITAVHEKYKDIINPQETDQFGQSVEMQVLLHAKQTGIKSYRAAYLDLFHDRLLGAAESKGKEALLKEQEKRREKGFIGRTPTPTQGITQAQNVRSRSWGDLEREALEELGVI